LASSTFIAPPLLKLISVWLVADKNISRKECALLEKAVALVSGGICSAVAAAVARDQYEVAALHVAWGHRSAAAERRSFEAITAALEIHTTSVAELPCLANWGGNARSNRKLVIEDANTLQTKTPATFAFGVMPTMLSLAATWAKSIGADRIITGTVEDFETGSCPISHLYPDHRIEFLQTFNLMLYYAQPAKEDLIIEAPLIELSRKEIVQLGAKMHIPFKSTWSCYQDNQKPCGRCLGCQIRTSGFLSARIADPIHPAAAATA
jgi:7-cyano-7-deazaguanine synthase